MVLLIEGSEQFDPCLSPIDPSSSDEVLRFLDFSDPDFSEFLTLPPRAANGVTMELLNVTDDSFVWDFDGGTVVGGTVLDGAGDGIQERAHRTHRMIRLRLRNKFQIGSRRVISWIVVVANYCEKWFIQMKHEACHPWRVGFIYHATLDIQDNTDVFMPAMQQLYIDLSAQSIESVKQFLMEYGHLRRQEEYVIIHDSLCAFYDALCAKMDYETANIRTVGTDLQASEPEPGLCQSRQPEREGNLNGIPKTGIAAQRERTGKMHLKDLADYFHLPIQEAAKRLNICSTALKKICRRHDVPRWPYRKIKSLDRMISSLEQDLRAKAGKGVAITQADIKKLREERAQIYLGGSQS